MFLRPAMKQAGDRLTVLTNVLATRITFDKQQATGIEYQADGRSKRAFATREVVFYTVIIIIIIIIIVIIEIKLTIAT